MGFAALLRDRSIRVAALGVVTAAAGVVVLSTGGATAGEATGRAATSTTTTAPVPGFAGGDGPLAGSSLAVMSGVGLDGRPVSTRPHDRPLVVVIWDANCRCDPVFAAANAVVLTSGGAADVVGINLDRDIAAAAQANLDHGLLFASMTDGTGSVRRLVSATPHGALLVVDRDGTVVADFRDGVQGGPEALVHDVTALAGS